MLLVKFVNKSGMSEYSDYDVTVLVTYLNTDGDIDLKTISRGSVTGHERSKGWKALVRRFVEEHPDG